MFERVSIAGLRLMLIGSMACFANACDTFSDPVQPCDEFSGTCSGGFPGTPPGFPVPPLPPSRPVPVSGPALPPAALAGPQAMPMPPLIVPRAGTGGVVTVDGGLIDADGGGADAGAD